MTCIKYINHILGYYMELSLSFIGYMLFYLHQQW